jgi:hypothetical protein
MLACQAGLRASELTGLAIRDVHLGTEAHGSCTGNRHSGSSPLTSPPSRSWTSGLLNAPAARRPLFIVRRGTPLSRDALERRNAEYAGIAARSTPASPAQKKVSPRFCATQRCACSTQTPNRVESSWWLSTSATCANTSTQALQRSFGPSAMSLKATEARLTGG